MFAYSTQTGHLFHRKRDSRFRANRTPVSEQTGHPFQTKLDSLDAPAALSH